MKRFRKMSQVARWLIKRGFTFKYDPDYIEVYSTGLNCRFSYASYCSHNGKIDKSKGVCLMSESYNEIELEDMSL